MIGPVQLFWVAFALGLLFGSLPSVLTLKGFLNAYFKVRFGKNKRLLAVHNADGVGISWRVGFLKDGLWQYKHAKGDVRAFSMPEGSVKRFSGVSLAQ